MSCDTTSSGSLVEIFYLHFGFRTFGNSHDFLDLFGRVSLFGFLTQDFGGTSAFQQGDFDVSFSLEKEISVFNFFRLGILMAVL
ncbi:hypothetical protein RhiirA1_543608 [Rhizophagus irregularis]|uniref:Uncharacterized protein n=2 Tax=Rhizophagus irregularis TaxID=588596 RepID=A0A2N0QLL3_9GLOM|nr:hypothetical protein RhiirA1_543608 [Rhizophagus irregularis]